MGEQDAHPWLNVATYTEAIAAKHPEREALVFRDRRFTWDQVAQRSRRLANVLASAGLGVTAEFGTAPRWQSVHDQVALYLHNGNEYLEGMLGAWKARCAPFNVNYRYVAEELTYLIDDASARAVIYHECFAPVLADVLGTMAEPPGVLLQVADGSGNDLLPGASDYEEALAGAAPDLTVELRRSWSGDDLYLCYTGGTTGMPKGAMWRQEDFLVSALGVRRRDGTDYGDLAELLDDANGAVRALPAAPLMHGAAHWNALSCWSKGGCVVIQDRPEHFDAADVLDSAVRHGATSLLIVGDPMARPLIDELEARPRPLDKMRHVLSGGAVLSPTSKARLQRLLPEVTILDVLGSTESGRQGVATTAPGGDTSASFKPSATTTILAEDLSRRLDAHDPGVGWLAQGGRVPLGYLGDPEKTDSTFPEIAGERFAVAGDRARWLPDGTVELLGRDSVCINTGGEKVFAEEVETAIKTHPDVYDAVVCGRPSDRWGEEVVAIVAVRDGTRPSDADLIEAAGAHIAHYKLPKEVLRVGSVLRSPSGKADYRWARAQATAPG